ncbi:hypothetical protein LOK49_LG03G00859 [Camellia lanceoleosa]|uniref:Uncharacterized protein n=1 Tax=Camellia lanceoleosa TaxID=1840588 RepID=A0ACC0IGL0_9ERIC|nr:hypothetical protein LOK49_LG03G00859 [Camellia lanceoleosa]
MYPPQQQPLHPQHSLDQQYPVFYMPARQAQAYNLPVHQSNYSETAASIPSSRPQTPPPPSIIPPSAAYGAAQIAPPPKPEMATGMYRTSTVAGQALSSQHQPQYVGFSQIHHPSQSIAPNSATTNNYGYEFADPAHAQLYYAQPMASQLAAQYQTMASNPAVVLPETSAQLPADNVKQQIRTSQP